MIMVVIRRKEKSVSRRMPRVPLLPQGCTLFVQNPDTGARIKGMVIRRVITDSIQKQNEEVYEVQLLSGNGARLFFNRRELLLD